MPSLRPAGLCARQGHSWSGPAADVCSHCRASRCPHLIKKFGLGLKASVRCAMASPCRYHKEC